MPAFEKVFAVKIVENEDCEGHPVDESARSLLAAFPPDEGCSLCRRGAPYFSTTGDGMLAVTAAMLNRRLYLSLIFGEEGVQACFRDDDGDFDYGFPLHHHEAPKAVCLAALKALGVEVPA